MWPDRVSNSGPLTYESGALPTALRGPALFRDCFIYYFASIDVSSADRQISNSVVVYCSRKNLERNRQSTLPKSGPAGYASQQALNILNYIFNFGLKTFCIILCPILALRFGSSKTV